MADVINETAAVLNETAKNATAKIPATPEGMATAYGSLVVMALVPIFFGSLRSVRFHKEQKESGEQSESMSNKDAAMFPLIASVALFGIYLFFKIFSKEYINMLLSAYFFFLGVFAMAHILSPLVHKLVPNMFPNMNYHLLLVESEVDQDKKEKKDQNDKKDAKDKKDKPEELMNYKFDRKDLLCLGLCAIVGVWYLTKKHWLANNLFGLAFSVNGVEFLQLNRFSTGCILLGGLFIYDIFWVFGTNVMVTVAKSFEAPIKLVFPQDLLEKGLEANNFAMLGLGDIVIPGILIALLLRFDVSQNKGRRTYFYTGFLAYFLGLMTTIGIMHVFKHAQPALLYLVPACLGAPILVAAIRGELKDLFGYEDNPEADKENTEDKNKEETKTEDKKDK
ncbi:hypothetical protein NP493_685g01060 [Ridgeia piscesae]|uniref:Minor histocompatibility antigen H13 n=1 Tax=Ridgeia piscesae TaxID=27915 RepID=A0AAD9NQT2_RIDPI|nr:hypothetical protein NP493_685g01060 [Ridgeia piscesae]